MTAGTGIFLGSIIIGLVMLYGQTKDRWKWFRGIFDLSVKMLFHFGKKKNPHSKMRIYH